MKVEQLNQQITLSDGRKLGFAEYGPRHGAPVFYFHGWPSSRLEPRTVAPVLNDLSIRIIAADRPGYGLSGFHVRRSIVDFLPDVQQLADQLGLSRFAVLGVSGGGPYAAACASQWPDRVTAALLVCSVAPMEAPGATEGMVIVNRLLLTLARRTPWLARVSAGVCMKVIWGRGEQVIPKSIELRLPAADKQALAEPHLREALTDSSKEALRHGVRAAACDGLLYARPWGFPLHQIRIPVHLWHGEKDIIVPPTMGRYLARVIPGCRAIFLPHDGHFSLPYQRARELFAALEV